MDQISLSKIITKNSEAYQKIISINYLKTCPCLESHLNCMTAKEWIKCQLGVWQFTYENRDIRVFP